MSSIFIFIFETYYYLSSVEPHRNPSTRTIVSRTRSRNGQAYLFAAPPHPRPRLLLRRLQAPRRRPPPPPTRHRLAEVLRAPPRPQAAPSRAAPSPAATGSPRRGLPLRQSRATGTGWRGRRRLCAGSGHRSHPLLPEGRVGRGCRLGSGAGGGGNRAVVHGAAGAGLGAAWALPLGGRHGGPEHIQVGAAGQRVGGVPGRMPAHALGPGPPGRAGAAVHRPVAGGERGGGRALGLRPRRRPGHVRPALPRPQGPAPHRGAPHLGHPRRRPHPARHRRHRHPGGHPGGALRRRRARGRHRGRAPARQQQRAGEGAAGRRRQEEGDQLRDVRHGDRARAAARRAHDHPAGARHAVARRRRRLPRHVPRRHRAVHGQLHRAHRHLHRGAQGEGAPDHGEAHLGGLPRRHLHGGGHHRQRVLRGELVLNH